MKKKEYTITITGSGTKTELLEALQMLQDDIVNILNNPDTEEPKMVFEDAILCSTISIIE